MKILQVALGKQEDIRDALLTLGDVVYWDWSGHDRSFSRDLRNLVDHHNPDVVFMQIQTAGRLDKHTAAYVHSKSFTINWTGDVRTPLPQWFKDVAPFMNVTLFTNMVDVEHMRSLGFRSDYLQVGFPDKIFNRKAEVKECADIVFMANNVGGFPLSSFRKQMVDILKLRYGSKFRVYGIGWPGYDAIHDQNEEVKFYRGAKIAINLSHFNYKRYSSDRLFRAMGSGCFVLSHNYDEIEKEFEPSNHLVTWSNFEQLTNFIDYYLVNESERKSIARRGYDHVHKNHSWKARVPEIERILKEYK